MASNNSVNNRTVNASFVIGDTNSSAAGRQLDFIKTRDGGAIVSGDSLGSVRFIGYDGTQNTLGAKISSNSSGVIGSMRIAGDLQFFTHPDSAGTSLLRMVIASTGAVTINAPDSGVGLTVGGGLNVTGSETITSGDLTLSSGNITATSGNLVLTAATTSSVGQITQAGSRLLHTYGTDNSFLGSQSGNVTLTATRNTGIGVSSCFSLTSNGNNAGLGFYSLNLNTGSNNTALGSSSGYQIASGSNNTLIGYLSGSNYTSSESNNIILGSSTNGTAAESNVLRIGNGTGTSTGQINKSIISGIFGITVGASGIAVVVDNTGQLGTVVSSIRYKDNVEDMSDSSSSIMSLRPVIFNYKSDKNKIRKYGLIAEEVEKVMPELVVYNDKDEVETVKYLDLPVLLLNELQKVSKELQDALNRIKTLENKLAGV